jgi:hypothetical protein
MAFLVKKVAEALFLDGGGAMGQLCAAKKPTDQFPKRLLIS